MGVKDYRDDDDDDDGKSVKPGKVKLTEFDCPGCNANNPSEEFGDKSVVSCGYCGMDWEVRIDEDGKPDFKEA